MSPSYHSDTNEGDSEAMMRELRAIWPKLCLPPRVPGYEGLKEIGKGGQGIVYRAYHPAKERWEALKVLRGTSSENESQASKRFEQERVFSAGLQHPNIVTLYDCGVCEDGRPYLAFELVEGATLQEALNKREEWPALQELRSALRLFLQVCDGVGSAHRGAVLHRDLKPGNILLSQDGTPKISDFGIGQNLQAENPSLLTITNQFLGSLAYSSPEQARGDKGGADIRTDVYGLGAVLYHILTGSAPHRIDGELSKAISRIIHSPPARPSTIVSLPWRIDAGLDAIVLTALALDKQDRYRSVDELADDVRAWLNGEPLRVRHKSLFYDFRAIIRRHRVVFSVAASIAAISIVSFLVVLDQRMEAVASAEFAGRTLRELILQTDRFSVVSKDLGRIAGGFGPYKQTTLYVSEQFEQFLELYPNDSLVLEGFARAKRVEGDLHMMEADPSLAIKAFQDGLAAAVQLESLGFSTPKAYEDHTYILIRIGDAYILLENDAATESFYIQALRVHERLFAKQHDDGLPARPRLAEDVFWGHVRLAEFYLKRDLSHPKGRGHLLALTELVEKLPPEDLGERAMRMKFKQSAVHTWLALQEGDWAHARETSRRAMELAGTLSEMDEFNASYHRFVMSAHEYLAQYYEAVGNIPAALKERNDAVEDVRGLVERERDNLDFLNLLYLTLRNQGMAQVRNELWDDALHSWKEAKEIMWPLFRSAPSLPKYERQTALILHQITLSYLNIGGFDAAKHLLQSHVAFCIENRDILGGVGEPLDIEFQLVCDLLAEAVVQNGSSEDLRMLQQMASEIEKAQRK